MTDKIRTLVVPVVEIKVNSKYDLPQAVNRPIIRRKRKLDLSGELGRVIVKSETERTLKEHADTFQLLASM